MADTLRVLPFSGGASDQDPLIMDLVLIALRFIREKRANEEEAQMKKNQNAVRG